MIDIGSIKVHSILDVESVIDLYYTVKPNEHAYLCMTVNIRTEFKGKITDIMDKIKDSDISIETVNVNNENPKVMFRGLIESCKFTNNSGVRICRIEALSKSILLDRNKDNKLFQDKKNGLRFVVNKTVEEMHVKVRFNVDDKEQGALFLQYQESNWDFIRRVASHDNQVVIPDYKSSGIGFHYGILYNENAVNMRANYFEAGFSSDSDDYNNINLKNNTELLSDTEPARIKYRVSDYADYELGRKVSFLNKSLYIIEKEAELKSGCIVFTYKLCTKAAVRRRKIFNEKIPGLAVSGTVVDVKEEDLYIKFDIDKAEAVYPFPWLPVTGNVMYLMPEKGSRVQVNFGDEDENRNHFASHIIEQMNSEKLSTDIKGLITKDSHNMILSNNSIKCGGNSVCNLSSGLLQLAGNKTLQINAEKSIEIKSEMITFDAQDEVRAFKR